jgi:uncharacterized zinc-type alcohol dehydrogenase-like protein
MCDKCNNNNLEHVDIARDRRKFLKMGAALSAAPLLAGLTADAQASSSDENIGKGSYPARAYGATGVTSPLKPMNIHRRALGPRDVLLDVLYCGVCHSDIHQARNEWPLTVPTIFPVVPGHEIIGRVRAIGNQVTKFRVDDIGGVGCMVDSCGTCENCLSDREQNCLNVTTFTYNSPDKVSGGLTYGGYSDKMVVKEHFVVRIPPGVDLPAMAPLLCAGITTFSPIRHWRLKPGQRVGVIGLGGLGHMAVKLAVSHRADVTVFTTTPGKIADAKKMGAKDAVLWNDEAGMNRYMNQLDLMITTVPRAYPMQPFMNLLKLDGTLVNVGALEQLKDLDGMMIGFGRKSLAGSMIGGIAETQEVIDYCAARNIKADIELIRIQDINRVYERVVNKDVRYRFVIDMKSLKA